MKVKIPVIIAVRLGSSRLPGKALKPFLDGRSMLDHIIERARSSKYVGEIVIATTTKVQDDELVAYAAKNYLQIYRGSENNVADRIAKAAEYIKADCFYEVLGDNPFIDPLFFEKIYDLYNSRPEAKYISCNTAEYGYNHSTEFPIGIRVQFVKTMEMQKIQASNNKYYFEHATSYFYDKIDQKEFILIENDKYSEDMSNINFAVNTISDFYRTGLLLNEVESTSWLELYNRYILIK